MPTIEEDLNNPSEEELDNIDSVAKNEERAIEKTQREMPESGASVKTLWKLLKNPLRKSRGENRAERHQKHP